MTTPTYTDNKPTNLQAAIIDAMYWLRVLRSRLYDDPQLPLTEKREHQAYLRLAIQALEGGLSDDACPDDDRNGTEAKQAQSPLVGLTPAQRAEVNLIKEKLRAKQQAMRAAE